MVFKFLDLTPAVEGTECTSAEVLQLRGRGG